MFRKHKYNAVRTNGFGSRLESAVYDILKLREKSGEIRDIKCQVPIVLQEGKPKERIVWKCDFSFIDVKTGETVFCESKGMSCQTFNLKLRLFRKVRKEKLEIWRGSYQKPFLSEVINV